MAIRGEILSPPPIPVKKKEKKKFEINKVLSMATYLHELIYDCRLYVHYSLFMKKDVMHI